MITAVAITIPEASYFSCEQTSSFFALTSSIWTWTAAILASNCAWHLPSALGRDTSGSYSVVSKYVRLSWLSGLPFEHPGREAEGYRVWEAVTKSWSWSDVKETWKGEPWISDQHRLPILQSTSASLHAGFVPDSTRMTVRGAAHRHFGGSLTVGTNTTKDRI